MPCTMFNNTVLPGYQCPDKYICTPYWEGPAGGIVSFDNIGLAMLTVFSVMTLSAWSLVLYYVSI